MSQVKADKSTSSMANVSSPLRFELLSSSAAAMTPTSAKRSLQSQEDINDEHDNTCNSKNNSPIAKRSRIDSASPSSPHLLRRMLTPSRSAMLETSNLFDQPDIMTQERIKCGGGSLNYNGSSSDIVFTSSPAPAIGNNASGQYDVRNYKVVDRDKMSPSQRHQVYNNQLLSPQQQRHKHQQEEQIPEDDDDYLDDLPLASYGDPGFQEGNNNNFLLNGIDDDYPGYDDEEEVFNHARRSLLSELKSSEIAPHFDEPEVDDEERLQFSKSLLDAVWGDEEATPVAEEGAEEPAAPAAPATPLRNKDQPPSRIQQFDDECTEFFTTSHVDDNETTEPLPTSSLRRTYAPSSWQRIKPAYLTTHPRFLTSEYFKEHNATSCMHEEEDELYDDGTMVTSYFEAKYTVLETMGSGEYAEVFKVQHVDTGHLWAVKRTKLAFCSYDDRWQQIIEVDHMRAVSGSEHCVGLADAWEQEGKLYIQMELCANGSLGDYIDFNNRHIPELAVWSILSEIAQGVKAIHDANIIHLDLKPSNILIDDSGSIKIGDFGVSVREPVDLDWVKGEGDRRYMAPDLLRDQFHKPADIFSLGLIVLEMATGIVLPDTGEPWEELRLADFSGCEEALAKTSRRMRDFIEWLMQINSRERPTIDQVIAHPEVASRVAKKDDHNNNNQDTSNKNNTQGILYEYVQQVKNRMNEEPIGQAGSPTSTSTASSSSPSPPPLSPVQAALDNINDTPDDAAEDDDGVLDDKNSPLH